MTLRLGSFIPHQLACVFTYAVATSIRCVSVVLIVLTVEAVNGDGTWWDRREAQEGKVGVWGGTVKVMPGARYMGGDGLGVNTFRFNSVRHSSDSEGVLQPPPALRQLLFSGFGVHTYTTRGSSAPLFSKLTTTTTTPLGRDVLIASHHSLQHKPGNP